MMLGLSDKEIEALRKGTWELRCLSMELKRQDGKHVFNGSGIIRQDEQRQLVFTLLDTQHGEGLKTAIEDWNKPDLSAGQIIPMGHYYELHAADNSGNTWCSLPTTDINPAYGPSNGVVVSGNIRELWHIEDHTERAIQMAKDKNEPVTPFFKHPYWDYYCFNDIGRFPCNAGVEKSMCVAGREIKKSSSWSVSRTETEAFIFELQKDEGVVQFQVEGRDNHSYPDNIEYRFVEALQFVLGRPFDWEVMVICSGNIDEVCIRPRPSGQSQVRMLPPLAFTAHHHVNEFWQLYQKYLTYILPFSKAKWHPISRRVFTLQHGMSALWPIQMLVAGVEVEGMLKDAFGVNDKCETELKKLAANNIVRLDDALTWCRVRGNATHAEASETEISQENVIRLKKVLVVFYHLIFHLIGYQGKYTDYGELKYPIKTYPA